MAILNKVIFCLAILALFFSARQALAADQIKTTEFYVYDSAAPVSSLVSRDFPVYIGDNISDVANPVKSAFFKVSGVYTGGGNLILTLNSGNSQTFALPSVGATPTYFELLYADTSSVINPSSAGNYTYNFSLAPNSVTIYGLGIKLNLTYQYQPAACPDGTGQKIKTTEYYVYDSDVALSSSASHDFPVYIGDNISQVSAPIKSAYFKISGTYTGGGSVNLTLNSGNSQTFALPSVGATPTYFELLYADTSSVINPSSAGNYSYNLGLTPSGATIYGAGVILDLTYQYAPASCAGMPATGELTSVIFDTIGPDAMKPAYNSIMWQGTFNGGNGRVRFQLATADSSSGPWNYFGSSDNGITCDSGYWYDPVTPDTPIEITCAAAYHNNQRYFRYKVQLCSDNCIKSGDISPQVTGVIVNWSP